MWGMSLHRASTVSLLSLLSLAACAAETSADDAHAQSDAEEIEVTRAPAIAIGKGTIVAPDLRETSAWKELALSKDGSTVAFLATAPFGESDMSRVRFTALDAKPGAGAFATALDEELLGISIGLRGAKAAPHPARVADANAFLAARSWVSLRMTRASDDDRFHVGRWAVWMDGRKVHVTHDAAPVATFADPAAFTEPSYASGNGTTCRFTPSLSGVAVAPVRRVLVVEMAQAGSSDFCNAGARTYAFRLPD